jgi:ABC-type transporter Mla subunit MlaD
MLRTRFSAALYLLIVFASGILVGVVSHRLYVTSTASANTAPRTMDEFRKRYLSEMKEKVGANDQQLASVATILNETKQKFDNLHAQEKPLHDRIQQDQVDAIKALLTDQQKVAYDEWRAEREKRRQLALAQKKKK